MVRWHRGPQFPPVQLRHVQEILADQVPVIYTASMLGFASSRPELGNVRPAVHMNNTILWNLEELYLRK